MRIISRFVATLFLIQLTQVVCNAQLMETFEHHSEYGASVGVGHYFGDLNTAGSLKRPKFSASAFFRMQFNNYVGMRVNGSYAFLAYSDTYSSNLVQRTRNLSFNSDVWEISVSGDFNFFRFYPEIEGYRFTPYVSLGVGVLFFDPYAYLNGRKVFLRSIGTEGQGSTAYPGKKKYSNMAMTIPLCFGMKYNISDRLNLFGEVTYHFTNTDYLDDVSGTYAPDAFTKADIGSKLQDRSYEIGPAIGIKGRQRGNSSQKDAYATFQLGVSVNIMSYKCPKF